jgi:hypothetical protein
MKPLPSGRITQSILVVVFVVAVLVVAIIVIVTVTLVSWIGPHPLLPL